VAVVTSTTCQFPTPAEGDWLLLMKTQTESDKAPATEPEKQTGKAK
jgi:hypothetical protein